MSLREQIIDARNTPAKYTVRKVLSKFKERLAQSKLRKADLAPSPAQEKLAIAHSFYSPEELLHASIDESVATVLIERYYQHRFDLLGSGWVSYGYAGEALGLEGNVYRENLDLPAIDAEGQWLTHVVLPAHLEASQAIWQRIDDPNYQPIDWQKEAKTGVRFSAKAWCKDQGQFMANKPGVDIKVPWEIGRLQHLPRMALMAHAFPQHREKLLKEFRHQVLDFLATNPTGMGVQWAMSMDVGIRMANLLVAYDLFKQQDRTHILDQGFVDHLELGIVAHGNHLMHHLEHKDGLANNHYLGNLAGLLFAGGYLQTSSTANHWLEFAAREMSREVEKQFEIDGGNFESSTAYHRLSLEMIYYCYVLLEKAARAKPAIFGLPETGGKATNKTWVDLTQYWRDTINLGSLFLEKILTPVGELPQFGDNDSGRFLPLIPAGSMMTAEEAESRYTNLQGYTNHVDAKEKHWDENPLIPGAWLAKARAVAPAYNPFEGTPTWMPPLLKKRSDLKHQKTMRFEQKKLADTSLREGLELAGWPFFGVYVFQSKRVYLAINALNQNTKQYWSHGHNDKLSFELWLDGKPMVIDPGTYVYTPLYKERNQFRSVYAHPVPIHQAKEQNPWYPGKFGVFRMVGKSHCQPVHIGKDTITIRLLFDNVVHDRTWTVTDELVMIDDHSNTPFELNWPFDHPYSPGYGKRMAKHSHQ